MKDFWLHSCSRCGGDLHDVPDIEGSYVACLQCGHVITAPDEALLRATGKLPEMITAPVEVGAA